MHRNVVLGVLGIFAVICGTPVRAGEDGKAACAHCQAPDGCCYQNVVRQRCVMVPDKKQIKKTVYECREVPFCVHSARLFGHGCCAECESCPRFKKVLVKREIVVSEVCTTQCVVEEYVERVLAPCCHCGHDAMAPIQAAEPMLQATPAPPAEPKSAFTTPPPVFVSPVEFLLRR